MNVATLPDRPHAPATRVQQHQRAILILLGLWLVLFFSALFSPPLIDDADATHASAARHIALSGDWVTLQVNGIRYLEKAPLPYWLVALSFKIFGFNTFAAHLPQAIAVLLLALLGYRWANQSFGPRAALYTGLATLTSVGVFLFTRVFIPEVLLSLLICTSLYCLLQSLSPASSRSRLYPYAMWTALALAVLTKGLVALVFFFGTAIVFCALTGDYKNWRALKPFTGTLLFLVIAAPWHILAGLRNTGGMNGHGFFWFYFVNEHFLRFLGKRYPMDYNKLPGYLFWSLHLVWLFPWALFAPIAILSGFRTWQRRNTTLLRRNFTSFTSRTVLLLTLFSAFVLAFFSLSTNQEYYTFPAYLPLLILICAALTRAEELYSDKENKEAKSSHRWITFAQAALTVIGLAAGIALALGLWNSRHHAPVSDIGDLLAHRGVGDYTLSMSHFFDLTGPSFAALRLPATIAAIAFAFGPAISWFLRTRRRHLAATTAIALTSAVFLIAAHIALIRFGTMLSSANFAEKIQQLEATGSIVPNTEVILYGDQSYGSSIPFYLGQQVKLVDGRSSSLLFGSTFPDAPHIFLTDADLLKIWGTGARKILFVPLERRDAADQVLGSHNKILLAETSGKALFTDRPLDRSVDPPVLDPPPSDATINSTPPPPSPIGGILSLLPATIVGLAILGVCVFGISLFRNSSPRAWSPRSIYILVLAWLILQLGGIFTPGLLDDVDSVYIEIAREMLHRHDLITPYINGIRFFDKPPLLYWMASSSMTVFGETDWAARLPLTIAVLGLLLSVYALGIRLFKSISPAAHPDRGGLYAALAIATSIGTYLFTRFYIPDILLCLWMTLAVHLFLIALGRIHARQSSFLPCLAFAAVMALNILTKGLIGLVFPIAFVILYLALTKQLRLLSRLHLIASTAVFAAIAAPWHILAALRNPPIALPSGLGLPAQGGWSWFYLYNEHIARFFSKRIPHDYGQTPVWLFWLMLLIWIMPWGTFLPAAIFHFLPQVRARVPHVSTLRHGLAHHEPYGASTQYEASLSLFLWIAIVLGFFTLSARQEYYSLPALPALALLSGGVLAYSETHPASTTRRIIQRWFLFLHTPLTLVITAICGYFAITAPHSPAGTDLSTLLSNNPNLYNLSLGHLYDLTGAAMGLFRGPLTAVALSMIAVGPISYLLYRRGRSFAANLTLAAGMTGSLLAAHIGYVRFNPILGSKDLALSIVHAQQTEPAPDSPPALSSVPAPDSAPAPNSNSLSDSHSNDLIILDGELTSGSTLVFYTRQQVHLINGRVNGLWYGSFWPDAPAVFETDASLHHLWSSPRRIFLFTYNPTERQKDLAPYGPVHTLTAAGGKTILTNQ